MATVIGTQWNCHLLWRHVGNARY